MRQASLILTSWLFHILYTPNTLSLCPLSATPGILRGLRTLLVANKSLYFSCTMLGIFTL